MKSLGYYKTGMAGYGVTLFFALSGYLITYLLLHEKNKYSKVDLPKFYIRRILRIWPIYYLSVFIALLLYFFAPDIITFKKEGIALTFILYSLLLSNVGYGMGLGISTLNPLWSVGVEEQFYAFWPLLVNKTKSLLKTLFFVIIIYMVLKIFAKLSGSIEFYKIVSMSCFDCMAIGGIGAYLVYKKKSVLNIIYHPITQVLAWSFLLISIFYKPIMIIPFVNKEIHAIFYTLIILNVSTNKKSIINLENKLCDLVGKISYGIYVYHMIVLTTSPFIFKNLLNYELSNSITDYLIVYTTVIGLTLLLSYLSFNYFESFFLKKKHKFSKIESKSSLSDN
jgi:peptidoglycan/LPS O-acetylase OafA/YrhL